MAGDNNRTISFDGFFRPFSLARFPKQAESDLTYLVDQKNGDQMIKQLLHSVIAKYRDLSVSRRSIICLSLRLRQIIDLLATDKSRYFA